MSVWEKDLEVSILHFDFNTSFQSFAKKKKHLKIDLKV